jgi:exodeoxyribonuclease-3
MRVGHLNVSRGCQGEPRRLERLKEWLARQDYDVVGLNELLDWDRPPGIHLIGRACGYAHADLLVSGNSPEYVGVLSKHPITRVRQIRDPFYHGLLHVIIRGVHFVFTHLTNSQTGREAEARQIAHLVRSYHAPILVLGDLNTLSPLDRAHYDAADVSNLLATSPVAKERFLTKSLEINYRPMQILLEAGLEDADASDPPHPSTPTHLDRGERFPAPLRVDYALSSPLLKQREPVARVLEGGEVETLSNHYPIECVWGSQPSRS